MSLKGNGVIGIRREDKNRWERRVSLTPSQVKSLIERGLTVYVQPSKNRAFADKEYEEVGAIIQEDLSPASTIMAVKEVPSHLLIPNRTYIFFSHTIKAQYYNMPLLDAILHKNIRLFDYERITDEKNDRCVRFGPFAGLAGAIDTLSATGDRLLALGYATPFIHIAFSQFYPSLDAARAAVAKVGDEIRTSGIHRDLVPFTITVTGTGSVATGVHDILKFLPCKYVSPTDLKEIWENKETADNKVVYVTTATAEHMVVPIEPGKPFDKKDYYANPSNYRPVFHENVLPYTRLLYNCMYWDPRFPRLCTFEQARELLKQGRFPLIADGDISCDPKGPIEFFLKATTIDDPLYLCDVETGEVTHSTRGKGVMFLAVDHLPAEFPVDASQYFGDHLIRFVEALAKSDGTKPFAEQNDLPPEMKKACITSHGELTSNYQYIWKMREKADKKNRILLLGAGFVVQPVVDYLMKSDPKNMITVGSLFLTEAVEVCRKYGYRASPLEVNVSNAVELDKLVAQHDIVISLVPAFLHHLVARACIQQKKHMLTASYISPEMKALASEIEAAGIVSVNEIGLDPGIDHFGSLKVIADTEKAGGRIVSYKSWCGALPAPEAANNPLAYKFSWSPRGVLVAAQAPSKFLWDGEVVELPGSLKSDVASEVTILPGFAFESTPNRDSMQYGPLYGIESTVRTLFRATLRYRGHSIMIKALNALGLLDPTPHHDLAAESTKGPSSWLALLQQVTGHVSDHDIKAHVRKIVREKFAEAKKQLAAQKSLKFMVQQAHPRVSDGAQIQEVAATEILSESGLDAEIDRVVDGLSWLGLLSSEETVELRGSLMDCLCALLEKKLKYEEDERDVVVMHHEFEAEFDSGKRQKICCSLCVYGETKDDLHKLGLDRKPYSGTSKTVGFPVGVVAQLMLDGGVKARGVVTPMDIHKQDHAFCDVVLKKLEEEGIKMLHSESQLI